MPLDAVTVVRRWIDAINTADIDLYRSVVSPALVHHSAAGDLGFDEVVEGFWYYKRAFPDLVYDLQEVVDADGGSAAIARWTMRGTHTGSEFFGAAASGKAFASAGLSLHRVTDGRITEEWEYNADLGQLRQLGFSLQTPVAS